MKKHDLYIFVDALGWEQIQQSQFLKDTLHFQNECATQFGYSSTCDPTIITGKKPSEHGHFSFYVKSDLNQSPFQKLGKLSFLPHKIAANHRIRNRLSSYFKRQLNYTGYFQLYSVPFSKLPYLDYTEKRDIYQSNGIINLCETAFDSWRNNGKKWYLSNWRNCDQTNLDHHHKILKSGITDKSYLILTKLDAVMHEFGPHHSNTRDYLKTLEANMRELIKMGENCYNEFYVHIFSDHGMHEVKKDSDLLKRWSTLPFKYGVDYHAVWDSTMARFWFSKESVRKKALLWLDEQDEGKLLTDDELSSWGCSFPNNEYGEHFYLLNPGVLMTPSFMNLGHLNGMHGYHPDSAESKACWLTNKPGCEVHELTDIYNTLVA